MKLKYIFPFFIAVIAVLTGCSNNQDASYLDGLRVSSSYVTLPLEGGSQTIEINAAADWEFVAADVPDGVTITPMSGSAGRTSVTISLGAFSYGHVFTLRVRSGGLVQEINVQQGLPTPELATCAEIIAGPDGKNFRVKGQVGKIASTTYGNYNLSDETGTVYIYGTLDKEGQEKNFSSLNIEEGDIITVEGPKKTYNGTIELVNVSVVKIEKTLVKVVTAAPTVAVEGGEIEVQIEYKGIGLIPVIPSDCDWIHQTSMRMEAGIPTAVNPKPANIAYVKFAIDANTSKSRKATIQFKSSQLQDDKTTYESVVDWEINQKGISNLPKGTGTQDDPYNVTAALAKAEAGATDVYIKGVVSKAPTSLNTKYNSLTYYISVDGNEEDELQIYSGKGIEGADFTDKGNIKKGDVVIVKGNLKVYKGQAEADVNNQLVQINGQTTLEGLDDAGSYRNPLNAEAAAAYIDAGGKDNVFVKGIVSELYKSGFAADFGNGSFFISDDGKKYGVPTKDFEAYQVYWVGNRKWVEGDDQIAVGDVVVIYGPLTKFNTTYETKGKGAAYIFSRNGKIE